MGAADDVQQTSTIDEGGAAPVWGESWPTAAIPMENLCCSCKLTSDAAGHDGKGETLLFHAEDPPQLLCLEVYDHDDVGADDLIGVHPIEFGDLQKDWEGDGWFPLKSPKGKPAGSVRVHVEYCVPPRPQWRLDAAVIGCTDLSEAANSKPLRVVARVGTASKHTGVIAPSLSIGPATFHTGAGPVWNGEHGERLVFDTVEPPETVHFDLYADESTELVARQQVLVGSHEINLVDLLADGWSWDTPLALTHEGEAAGSIRVHFAFKNLDAIHETMQKFDLHPLDGQSETAIKDGANQIVTWGNSSVLKVHNSSYQKVFGYFYAANNPGRKTGIFTAGLRQIQESTSDYKDMWVTVHRPPAALRVSFVWLAIPNLKNRNDPCGVLKLSIVDIAGLRAGPAVQDLVCVIKTCKQRFETRPARTDLTEITSAKSESAGALCEWGQTFIVKQAKRVETFAFEIYDRNAGSVGDASPDPLCTFSQEICAGTFKVDTPEERFFDALPEVYKDKRKAAARQYFDDVDEDGSGYLDREELRQLSVSLGYEMADAALTIAMKEMDDDDSGEVDFTEFYEWFEDKMPDDALSNPELLGDNFARSIQHNEQLGETMETALHAFKKIDTNNSGTINESELAELARSLGSEFSPEKLGAAMAEMRGEDGGAEEISFEQFHEWWLTHGQGETGAFKEMGMFATLFSERLSPVKIMRRRKEQKLKVERDFIHEEFAKIDNDGSGELDAKELVKLLRVLGKATVGQEELRATMVEIRDGEGADYDAVTFEQFYQWWLKNRSANKGFLAKMFDRTKSKEDQVHDEMVAAQEAFEIIDADGSGSLDRLEMFQLTKHLGMDLSGDALLQMMADIDMCSGGQPTSGGGPGQVNFEQFHVWWIKQRTAGSDGGSLKGIFSLKKIKKSMGNLTKSVAETAEARLLFDSFDLDASGTLDDSEVSELARALGQELSESDLAAAMVEMRGAEGGEAWRTAAIPMENPCCSCKLTRVRSRCSCADGVQRGED